MIILDYPYYPMSQNTSLVPPDAMPPLPPAAKAIVLVFSLLMTFVLVAFVGFVAIEFVAEMAGHPLGFANQDPTERPPLSIWQDMEGGIKNPFELVTPSHQTQIRGPEVVVIYTVRKMPAPLPDLRINDVQHPWEMQFGENTWFARLHLQAGMHHLQAGEAEADFFVTTPEATQRLPEFWLWNLPHLNTNKVDQCVDCHEMPERQTNHLAAGRDRAIGAWKGASSCFVCHEKGKHETVHRIVLPTTDRSIRCVRCHTIH